MVFEYHPNCLEVVESVWKFSIPSLKLSQSFLLVGYTLDPNVFFDRTFLSYQTLLIGNAYCICLPFPSLPLPFSLSLSPLSLCFISSVCMHYL